MSLEAKKGPQNGTLGRLALALALTGASAFGEGRDTTAVAVSSSLFRPPTLEVQDKLYRDYFASTDDAIRQTYVDRWRYHELQSAFYQPRSRTTHLDIGANTNPGGVGPLEADVRNEFAHTAFRMRLEAAFRKFLTHERATGVRKAHQFVENLKAQSVRVSQEPDSAEVRMGYDVLSDVSRVEYIKGSTGAGLYHGTFLSSLTGSKPLTDAMTFSVWKDWRNGFPSTSLSYSLGGKSVQGGLSKYLNPAVRGEVLAVKPVTNNGAPDSVLVRMTYTF